MSARRIFLIFGAAFFLLAATHLAAQDLPHPTSVTSSQATADTVPPTNPDPTALLDAGFRHLYELNFQGARQDFGVYQKQRPEDPLGKAAEAVSYLFEEFNDKGVLTSEFFLNDSRFLGGISGSPAANRNAAFLEANNQARELAKKSVKSDPHDVDGLLALTIADGLESDYDALIEKKQLEAIKLMHRAESGANATLAADSSAQDAYVALGVSNYVIGSLPGYKRVFLWMGGVHGNRARGIEQMQAAAEHGRYLRAFAKIMLALAYEREGEPDYARQLLAQLITEFPNTPVFSHELALLDQKPGHDDEQTRKSKR